MFLNPDMGHLNRQKGNQVSEVGSIWHNNNRVLNKI